MFCLRLSKLFIWFFQVWSITWSTICFSIWLKTSLFSFLLDEYFLDTMSKTSFLDSVRSVLFFSKIFIKFISIPYSLLQRALSSSFFHSDSKPDSGTNWSNWKDKTSSIIESIKSLISRLFRISSRCEYIIFLCSLRTSSNSKILFLISKFLPSTRLWALSIAFVSILCSMASPFSIPPIEVIRFLILSGAKIFIKGSSKETKNLEDPGSPCRPLLPLNWLSILLDSCLSVPMTCNPPNPITFSFSSTEESWPPKTMSVPLPAILVAIVTAPNLPASEIIWASPWFCFAFNTLWWIPMVFNFCEIISEASIEIVPIKIGLCFEWKEDISLTTASNFSSIDK